MKLLVIPNFGNRISPRLDYSSSLQLISLEGKKEIGRETVKMFCHTNLERLNLILGLKPDIVICNGLSDLLLNELKLNEINVIPWIHGEVNDVIKLYLNDKLDNPLQTKNKITDKSK